MCGGKAVNADVREACQAQWTHEWVADGRPQIGLTHAGERLIGRAGDETA
jgi:hypothetical protein